jgi:hypothetical protein
MSFNREAARDAVSQVAGMLHENGIMADDKNLTFLSLGNVREVQNMTAKQYFDEVMRILGQRFVRTKAREQEIDIEQSIREAIESSQNIRE